MPDFTSEDAVLAWIEALAHEHARAKQALDEATADLHAAVRTAGSLHIDGEPINRTKIIQAAGISRRTAYQLFQQRPAPTETEQP